MKARTSIRRGRPDLRRESGKGGRIMRLLHSVNQPRGYDLRAPELPPDRCEIPLESFMESRELFPVGLQADAEEPQAYDV
jgi:hypothetical protein